MLAGGRPRPNPPPEGEGIYIGWELGLLGWLGGLLGLGIGGILRQAQDERVGGLGWGGVGLGG